MGKEPLLKIIGFISASIYAILFSFYNFEKDAPNISHKNPNAEVVNIYIAEDEQNKKSA